MKDKTFLMIPGPTPMPESALMEMAKHPMAHRSLFKYFKRSF